VFDISAVTEHFPLLGLFALLILGGIGLPFPEDTTLILAGRHLIGLRAQLFLVAGVMRMPVLKFVLADAVSLSLTIAIMMGAGYVGGNSLQILSKDITRVEHILIFLAVIFLGIVLFLRYFKSGRKRTGNDY